MKNSGKEGQYAQYAHCWEKIHLALSRMIKDGTIQERLYDAYQNQLFYLRNYDIPDEIRDEVAELSRGLENPKNGVSINPEKGAIEAACRGLSDEDAEKYADMILSMYQTIVKLLHTASL